MKNLVAGKRRVNGIIRKLEAGGYLYRGWTEDGPHDSPKLEMTLRDTGANILVAVETHSIHVTPWGPGVEVAYVEFMDVSAFLGN